MIVKDIVSVQFYGGISSFQKICTTFTFTTPRSPTSTLHPRCVLRLHAEQPKCTIILLTLFWEPNLINNYQSFQVGGHHQCIGWKRIALSFYQHIWSCVLTLLFLFCCPFPTISVHNVHPSVHVDRHIHIQRCITWHELFIMCLSSLWLFPRRVQRTHRNVLTPPTLLPIARLIRCIKSTRPLLTSQPSGSDRYRWFSSLFVLILFGPWSVCSTSPWPLRRTLICYTRSVDSVWISFGIIQLSYPFRFRPRFGSSSFVFLYISTLKNE